MRLLIIRHGDPDYAVDSLTEKGRREAEFLAERMAKEKIDAFYVSPLGRAHDTAAYTLNAVHAQAKTLGWLREFQAPIWDKAAKKFRGPWDLLPSFYTVNEDFYDVHRWADTDFMRGGLRLKPEYNRVCKGLDKVLRQHGYARHGNYYKALSPNMDTLAFFCHFGVECVMLSHLLHVSPVVLWQGFCAAPTSVTTLYTEEREAGIAVFRCSAFGDISHLYAHGEPPAFAARFCEMYANEDERH